MAKKDINKEIVKTLKDKIDRSKSVLFTDYLGINSTDANILRQKMKDNDAEMVIAKNTLIKVAISETTNQKDVVKDLEGPTAAIFSYNDPISPIKTFLEFIQKKDFPKVKSAIIDNSYFSAEQVSRIKDIPSKEQILSQLVGSLKSPLSNIAIVLGGVQRKFVYTINAIYKSKGGEN